MSCAPRRDLDCVAHAPLSAQARSAHRRLHPVVTGVLAVLLSLLVVLGNEPRAEAASPRPTGLRVARVTAETVTLTWKSSAPGAYYRVKWSAAKDMSDPSYAVVRDDRATVHGLDAGTRYWFKVRRVTATDKKVSGYSAKVQATTAAVATALRAAGLRVGSYNVRCVSCTSDRPYERPWSKRRNDVAAEIKAAHLDVVGLQEASQAWLKDASGKKIDLSQFEDLRNRLGGPWRLANPHRNNCVRSKSPKKCDPKNRGASQGTKIIYNADRVALLRQGSKKLPSAASSNPRYVAWAEFRQRSTDKRFFFADAHLENKAKNNAIRVKEAEALADEVRRRNDDHLPTLIVGDMNSHKHTRPSNGVYDVLVGQRHYVDPLGNTWYSTDKAGRRAKTQTVEKRINTWLSSWNDFQKRAKGDKGRLNGTYLDYIFTTKMRVTEWETVADVDAKGLFRSAPPSDHNLIRATVQLP
jgi:endonuclease/exonuclease/phosphatase family metal-dependent hydrolase